MPPGLSFCLCSTPTTILPWECPRLRTPSFLPFFYLSLGWLGGRGGGYSGRRSTTTIAHTLRIVRQQIRRQEFNGIGGTFPDQFRHAWMCQKFTHTAKQTNKAMKRKKKEKKQVSENGQFV